jgi:hypothetical protein
LTRPRLFPPPPFFSWRCNGKSRQTLRLTERIRLLPWPPVTASQSRFTKGLIVLLGVFALAVVLAFHNITDGDLWAKLAIGSSLWNTGHLLRHDVFAFTPTLSKYIDHEWGAGFVFYALLRCFGPSALVILRMVLALGLLALGFRTGQQEGCDENILLLLAVPAAACILTGYIPVARSHVFTFFLLAATLFCLEEWRRGARWPAAVLPGVMLLWTNLHGGFVIGLGVIFIYAAASVISRDRASLMVLTAAACAAVTLINPYGLEFWRYLIPALLHPRLRILEWRPLPPLAWDDFWGFRLLFVLTVIALVAGWKRVERKNWPGLAVLAVTAFMGWRSRRHGPFFGAAALAYTGPYFQAVWGRRFNLLPATGLLYAGIALWVSFRFLPGASLYPLSPIGEDPVREVDILARAGVHGNVATPFAWGSYVSWRLYPNLKISMDGRYETTYPESTFDLNNAFYDHRADWPRLCRDFKVDYVVLDLQTEQLRPEALQAAGYVLITNVANVSALLCLPEHAPLLQKTARELPPNYTMDPFDLTDKGIR